MKIAKIPVESPLEAFAESLLTGTCSQGTTSAENPGSPAGSQSPSGVSQSPSCQCFDCVNAFYLESPLRNVDFDRFSGFVAMDIGSAVLAQNGQVEEQVSSKAGDVKYGPTGPLVDIAADGQRSFTCNRKWEYKERDITIYCGVSFRSYRLALEHQSICKFNGSLSSRVRSKYVNK